MKQRSLLLCFSAMVARPPCSFQRPGELEIDNKQAIEVNRRDGITLQPGRLSGRTYYQLYLAIRVALAKQVLGEEQGFFLFDDTFVKSGPVRRRIHIRYLIIARNKRQYPRGQSIAFSCNGIVVRFRISG